MDEATASLDVENETLVQQAISNLVKNKTVLIIAHRMRDCGRRRPDCGAKGWLCGGAGYAGGTVGEERDIPSHGRTSG